MIRIKLTEAEEGELKEFHRTLKDKKSSDRIKAILMLNKGYSSREVAAVLLLDENTITEWKKRYLSRSNFTSWLFNEYRGYKGKITETEEKAIEQYVGENLITDSKQVQVFIQERFTKTYTVSGVIALLNRMGFRYKQTRLIPSKYDAQIQKEWKKTYEAFVEDLKADETVVFADGMHPTHNTETSKAWIKEGKDRVIKSNTGRSRLNLNGAYNPLTRDIIVRDYKTLDTKATLDFLKTLEVYYPNKSSIYVIIDNARYFKNADVKDFVRDSRIELIFLPAYSPNLNLIERFWKLLKKEVIKNQFYEKFKDFKSEILDFCSRSSPVFRQLLLKSVGTKLHL